jgi:hypothetical protein
LTAVVVQRVAVVENQQRTATLLGGVGDECVEILQAVRKRQHAGLRLDSVPEHLIAKRADA